MSIQANDFSKDLISVLCPTRERPENVIRLVNSAKATAKNPDLIEFLFYVFLYSIFKRKKGFTISINNCFNFTDAEFF